MLIGLYFSNACKSIALVGLSVLFLIYPNKKEILSNLISDKLYLSSILLVFIYIISVLLSEDKNTGLIAMNNKISVLFLPITLYHFKKEYKTKIILIGVSTVLAFIQIIYAIYHAIKIEDVTQLYSVGNVLPIIKIHHVQFAVLISCTITMLISFAFDAIEKWKKKIAIVCASCLVLFIHFFAARTGILLTYLILLLYLTIQIIQRKKWKLLVGLMIGLIMSLSVFTICSNTIATKINYMRYDISRYVENKKDAFQFSDSRRLQAIENGIILIKKNPILGTGIGDIQNEINAIYTQQNPSLEKSYFYLPHSQYVYFLSVFGIPLGIIAIACFLYPIISFYQQKKYVLWSMYIGLVVFGIWDAFLGTLFGTCLYSLIIGIGIKKIN